MGLLCVYRVLWFLSISRCQKSTRAFGSVLPDDIGGGTITKKDFSCIRLILRKIFSERIHEKSCHLYGTHHQRLRPVMMMVSF